VSLRDTAGVGIQRRSPVSLEGIGSRPERKSGRKEKTGREEWREAGREIHWRERTPVDAAPAAWSARRLDCVHVCAWAGG
jgi:hypothetical protein